MADEEDKKSRIASLEALVYQLQSQVAGLSTGGGVGNGDDNSFPTWFESGGGGEPHFFKPVADVDDDITIGHGEVVQIGVGLSTFTEATHTVTGGTDIAKNYLIMRYKYSDGVISLDERNTPSDPTDNVYMELEICRVWLDTGAAFFDSYYGIGRYSFGGVLKS